MFQYRTLEEFKSEIDKPPSVRFQQLMKGMDVETDFTSEKSEPKWLDEEKYRAGRNMFMSFPMGILTSNFRSLVLGLSVPSLWWVCEYSFNELLYIS